MNENDLKIYKRKYEELASNLDEITESFRQELFQLLTPSELEDFHLKSNQVVGNGCDILFEYIHLLTGIVEQRKTKT